jgi:hypothetical protein
VQPVQEHTEATHTAGVSAQGDGGAWPNYVDSGPTTWCGPLVLRDVA